MPERRQDKTFATRSFEGSVKYFLTGGVLVWILLCRSVTNMELDWIAIACTIGLALSIAGCVISESRHFRRYRCPQCSAPIPRKTITNRRIEFHCERCDIIWDTTLSIPSD